MKRKKWVPLTTILAFSLVTLFIAASTQASTNYQAPGPALTATVTPTSTSTPTSEPPPVFTATMHVTPGKSEVLLGEILDVKVSIDVSEGCMYPIFELTLIQDGEDAPIFEYIDPITDTVIPGVPNPFTYTLRADRPGAVTFNGRAFGERYCGDYWVWRYVSGASEPVAVTAYSKYLPVIMKEQ